MVTKTVVLKGQQVITEYKILGILIYRSSRDRGVRW